ncbi:helix-turn-helix domain-containing protein [Pilimelia anulata]|nr:helix-turn-helix transcriptional regulator [Pilimelia anulata]
MIRRRRLAGELRSLRERAGLTAEQLAREAGKSRSMLSRFETADRVPTVADVSDLLRALGTAGVAVDDARWHELVQMASDAGERGWWESFGPGMGARQQFTQTWSTAPPPCRSTSYSSFPDFSRPPRTRAPARS